MKKRILLLTAVACMATFMLTSGIGGAGADKHYNCTGAETGLGNITGCSAGGCHGTTATSGITLAIELDSNGTTPTTHYKAGKTYTVKITGTNTTASTLPRFGFQACCIQGTVAATTPVNAGTFTSTGLPTSVRYTPAQGGNFVCNFIEHSAQIPATTGTGGSGTTYVESFSWTPPVAGTGNISFWCTLMGVNFNGLESGDFWNTKHVAISEWPAPASVAAVAEEMTVTAYPNPATTDLNVRIANTGTYSLQVFDMSGRTVAKEYVVVNGSVTTHINTSNWAAGTYHVVLQKDGVSKTISVVKK